MPTSATGRTSITKLMRGFTLLEMLVVLVVASIMLTIGTLQMMPGAQSVLREESQRLAFLMENGAMSSQAGGQPLAWSGTGNSYRFWNRTREGEWVRIEHDNLLHPRTLPEAVASAMSASRDAASNPAHWSCSAPSYRQKTFRVTLLSGDLVSDRRQRAGQGGRVGGEYAVNTAKQNRSFPLF